MRKKHIVLSLALAIVLSACGSGGSDGDSSSTSVNIDNDQDTTTNSSTLVSSVTTSDQTEDTSAKLIDNSSVALSMPNLSSSQTTNPLESIEAK